MIRRSTGILLMSALTTVFAWVGAAAEEDSFAQARLEMVKKQIEARGVEDPRVLKAMKTVPRHRFVPESQQERAYQDSPLSIGEGQTISQPYIVAFMTEALDPGPGDRILEIGTGSGYQAAVLSELVQSVYTVERIESLGEQARRTLSALGYDNVHVRIGDGFKGWPEEAPFDGILLTCAPHEIPRALIPQLKEGGRIIAPVGPTGRVQKLIRAVKRNGRLETRDLLYVRFVPMVPGTK